MAAIVASMSESADSANGTARRGPLPIAVVALAFVASGRTTG
jgi:hypothetical protein